MENEFRKIDIRNSIQRITNFYDNKVEPYQNQVYEQIKRDCLRSKKLFVDPLFPANNGSLCFKSSVPHGVTWKRARDIAKDCLNLEPKFIENIAHANDLHQGYIGDCWFIAAAAAISQVSDLFCKIVPLDQTFAEREYAGIFHFRFWIYGSWYDVCVDDFLPVYRDGSLVYCKNKDEPNEFWPALIEKAYAKLYGSYENLDGGFTADALVDMSGGIQETYNLKSMQTPAAKEELWDILRKSRQLQSMAAAYIEADPYTREARLSNGLVMGHAYTIVRLALIDYRGRDVRMIRLRNPWGNEVEWKGTWSDASREWDSISADLKNQLEYKNAKDGQFWMSYEDFSQNFHSLQFCNLTPDAFSEEVIIKKKKDSSTWKMVAYHGSWLRGKTAGGCGQSDPASFWTNPQFLVSLTTPDSDNRNNKCTIIVSLLQKYTREKRMKMRQDSLEEFIQFRIYKIKDAQAVEAAKRNGAKLYAKDLDKFGSSDAYINRREITKRFMLPPGDYLIIPSCFDFGHEGEFLLRIFTEKVIEERNTLILTEDKKKLTDEDIYFFKSVNTDQSFSSWVNLLGDGTIDDAANAKNRSRPSSTTLSVGTSNRNASGGVSPSRAPVGSTISNLVIKSSFSTSPQHQETTEQPASTSNSTAQKVLSRLQADLDVRKIMAKFENRKTVKETCKMM